MTNLLKWKKLIYTASLLLWCAVLPVNAQAANHTEWGFQIECVPEDAAARLTAGDGQMFCFIHGIEKKDGKWLLSIHTASYFSGDRADAEFRVDYPDIPYGPPDGYYIRGHYKKGDKLTVVPMDDDAHILILFHTYEGRSFLEYLTPEQFVKAVSQRKELRLWPDHPTPFWIKIQNGKVAVLANQFIP